MRRRAGEAGAVTLAYTLVSVVFLRPIWSLWRDHLAPDVGDPLFNTWVLAWSGRQIRLGHLAPGGADPWDANIFHPLENTLALSDHLFGPAALALPVAELTGSPVAAYNLLFLLSFVLCALTTYAVLRASGIGPLAAFFGGAAFTFAPYRWGQASHLQVLFCPWVPLVLWSFDRLLARPRPRTAALFLAGYLLHLGGGIYLAYMIHLPLLALLLNRALEVDAAGLRGWRRWLPRRRAALLGGTAVLAVAGLTALFQPYLEISRRLQLSRNAEEYRLFGANLLALLTPDRANLHFPLAESWLPALSPALPGDYWFAEKTLFPGVLVLLAALYGGRLLWRRFRRHPPPRVTPARRALLGASVAVGLTAFLTADLYTLGLWPTALPAALQHPGAVYSLLGLVLLLAVVAWAVLRWRWQLGPPLDLSAMPSWPRGLAVAGIATFLAAFPVVFEPLSELLPGLARMRVPARFQVFSSFALAALAAWGVDRLLHRVPRLSPSRLSWRWLAGAGLVLALLLELSPRPLIWTELPVGGEVPAVYTWLEDHDGEVEALLELPFVDDLHQLRYMYLSTRHWQPMVNGYSGHFPAPFRQLQEICCWPVPEAEALALLRRMQVSHLVVHPVWPRSWPHETFAAWRQRVESGALPGVREVYADSATGTRVYALAPASSDRPEILQSKD